MQINDYDDFCEKVICFYIHEILEYAKQENCQECINQLNKA